MSDKSASATASAPDIKQLKDRDLPAGKFPGEAKSDFRVFIEPKAYDEINKHAREDTDVEICGVLVGQWARDEKGPFLSVVNSIPGESATNKLAEVTFTHDTWSKINARMDKDFVGKSIVGWYHTHPDFGIFLSDRDRFVHEHFFNEPGQVALVVDPIRNQEGLFIWSAGKAVPSPYYWIGDKLKIPLPEEQAGTKKEKRESGGSKRQDDDPMESPWLNRATLAMAGICLFLLGYMLNGWLVSYERQRFFEVMQNSLGAIQVGQRIKLTQSLVNAANNTRVAAILLEAATRNPTILNDADREDRLQKANELLRASADLEQMRRQFGISDQEIMQLGSAVVQLQTALEAARAATSQPATTQPGIAMSLPPSIAATTQPTTEPAPR